MTELSPTLQHDRDALAAVDRLGTALDRLRHAIGTVIFGQTDVVDQTLVSMLAGGHTLLIGVPGLAKTRLVETMASATGLSARRIQCTPDLMPSDILGTEVLEEDATGRRGFRFIPGPVFCQLLMADEINRASPRTQSALLQAMQERQVSVAGHYHDLPTPFHVLATQNPLEQEGTYPLPEAQLDRFLMRIDVDYPDETAERRMLVATTGVAEDAVGSVMTPQDLIDAQILVRSLPVRTLSAEETRAATRPGVKAFSAGRADAVEPFFVDPTSREDWTTTPDGRRALEIALVIGVGNQYLLQSQLAQAEPKFAEAVRLADATGDPTLRGAARTGRAWVALRQGEPSDALASFDDLDPTSRSASLETRTGLRAAVLAVATARLEEGDDAGARELLEEARSLYRAADDAEGGALVLVRLGDLALADDDPARAAQLYAEADESAADGEASWAAPLGLARARAAQARIDDALAAYDRYVAALDRLARSFRTDQGLYSTIEAHSGNLDAMVALAVESGDPSEVRKRVAQARRRSLPELVSRDAARPVGMVSDRFLPPERREVRMMMQSTEGIVELPVDVVFPPADAPEGAVHSLVYYVLPDRTVMTVRDPRGVVHLASSPVGRRELTDLVAAYRRSIGAGQDLVRGILRFDATPDDPPPEAIAQRLHEALLAPVVQHLPEDLDVPLLVVPDGSLWSLPFAALRTPDGEWFGKRALHFGISASSVAASHARPRPTRPRRALVVGNPGAATLDACGRALDVTALDGAEAEAEAIAAAFEGASTDVDLLVGDRADAVRVDAWHGTYDVLHFATHGYVCDDDPLDSLLQVGQAPPDAWRAKNRREAVRVDDPRLPVRMPTSSHRNRGQIQRDLAGSPAVLTARHVMMEWRLEADLVTLSACETGLGQSSHEGTIGLLRAFVASGARSVLVSLWSVDDAVTRELMTSFYQGYLQHGDKGRALRDAMAAVRREHPDPYLWAAFALVGPP